jgi:hypothetical protein
LQTEGVQLRIIGAIRVQPHSLAPNKAGRQMAAGQESRPEKAAAERARLLKSLEEAREGGQPEKVDEIAEKLEALREEHPDVEEETKRLSPELGEELVPIPSLTVSRPLTPEDRLDSIARQRGDFGTAFDLVTVRRLTKKSLREAESEHGGIVRAMALSSEPVVELTDVMDAQQELEQEDAFKTFAGELESVARIRAEYKKLAHAFEIRLLDPKNLLEWLEEKDRLQSIVSGHGTEARMELSGKITDQELLRLAIEERKRVLLLATVIQGANSTGEPLRTFVRGLPGIEYTSERIVKPSKHDRQKPE